MKVTLNEDMIVSLTGGTEIGRIPRGVGLERLRWDGEKLVDLLALSAIHVRHEGGVFTLHAVAVPGSQIVTMRYSDRGRLYYLNGEVKVYSGAEWAALGQAEEDSRTDNRRLREEMVEFVRDLTFDRIDAHIDNVFGALTANQKASLKKLYKMVLYLAKQKVGK